MGTVMCEPREPSLRISRYGRHSEVFALPTAEDFLYRLLGDIFENHWSEVVFGPIIEGAAFEFTCPQPPTKIGLWDGYLTVDFGGPHFHLCIGETQGSPANPTSPAQRQHRRTARAEFFRGLDPAGDPVTWGLTLSNGAEEQLCTIFFPNPLLTREGNIATTPDWDRLRVWDELMARYLQRGPDPRDRSATRFYHG